MSFAGDLCDVIRKGIDTPPDANATDEPLDEPTDVSSTKNTFSDVRERRKLGKRILKAVQPHLETALRMESEISQKSLESLQHELESTIEKSVEAGRPITTTDQGKVADGPNDTIMVDASQDLQITVKPEPVEGEEDAMDTGADDEEGGNIEVNTSGLGMVEEDGAKETPPRTAQMSDTPPDSDLYVLKPRPTQSGPPTPPQSNGSLGLEPADPLTDGGIMWHLKGYEPHGTSIVLDHWAGREAVRMLSEDLTDLDDEELKGLGMDVDHGVSVGAAEMDLDGEAEAEAEAVVEVEVDVEAEIGAEVSNGKTRASRARARRTSTRRR